MTPQRRASLLEYLIEKLQDSIESRGSVFYSNKMEEYRSAIESVFQVVDEQTIEMFCDFAEKEISNPKRSSRKLEIMLLLQQPPNSVTDVEFLRGHCNGNQFGESPMSEHIGNHYRSVAESLGQNTKGKVYLSSLAKFPGDPKAWVAGRGDVQKVCEERNWGSTGLVNTKTDGEVRDQTT